MKISICTIGVNGEGGRQIIYLDTEDHLLHTDYDDSECYGVECATVEEARELAYDLLGRNAEWNLNWVEE